MFIADGIILKKIHIKESKNIIYLYTKEFGKISAWIKESKLKYPIDIGNIINISISTRGTVNQIESYKIKKVVDYSNLTFISIQNILELITYIYRLIPEGISTDSIFDEYMEILDILENDETNRKGVEFFKLKMIIRSGIGLNSQKTDNFRRIFEFIRKNRIINAMKIIGIEENLIDEISEYNRNSYSLYLT